jgi:serine/threonine protein kinase
MEYCAGGSVDAFFKVLKRPLSEPLIALVCREVLKGLVYLHSKHKIHRDIKGGNILLTSKGEVKLADFGVSTELVHTMSRRNSFIGTLYWMAPEAIQEKEYDERADLWSLGITVIEMAEGSPPHMGMHYARALFAIPKDPPPTLQSRDQWSPLMHKFTSRLLIKDPNARPTAVTMLSDPFVAPDRCNGRAELVEMINELILRRDALPTARRLGEMSTASSATFVERSSSTDSDAAAAPPKLPPPQKADAPPLDAVAPSNSPSVFHDGTVVMLPIIAAEDIALDEIGACAGALSPLGAVAGIAELLAGSSGTEVESWTAPQAINTTTMSVIAMYQYRSDAPHRVGLTAPQAEESRALVAHYGSVLKSILRI